ncbi:MAG: TetR family transcriptional regulator [Betaproteobacteria bacterium]
MNARLKIDPASRALDAAPTHAAKPARNAGDTRARILAAARVRFSVDAYENVGTRDIAADAGVDAALVNRYFGGKEKLFDEALTGAFAIGEHFAGTDMRTFGALITTLVLDGSEERREAKFDALGMLLRASGSPATAARVAARFHAEFVLPLAGLLRGRDAELRAALIASYLMGLATMKHALHSPALGAAVQRKAVALVGAAIQACVDGG